MKQAVIAVLALLSTSAFAQPEGGNATAQTPSGAEPSIGAFAIPTKWNCALDDKGKFRHCKLLAGAPPRRNYKAAGDMMLRRCTVSPGVVANAQRSGNRIGFTMTFYSTTTRDASALGWGIAGVTLDIRPKPICTPYPDVPPFPPGPSPADDR